MRSIGMAAVLLLGMTCGFATAQDDKKLVRGVSYVGLSVSDMDKALAMYSDACDMEVVDEATITDSAVLNELAGREGVTVETKMLEGPNAQIRLMQFAAPSDAAKATEPVPVIGPGMMHVCFQVLKEVQTYQRVLAAGATVIGAEEMAQLNPRRTI